MRKFRFWFSLACFLAFITVGLPFVTGHLTFYKGRPHWLSKVVKAKVTAYDICLSCCGKTDGITSIGDDGWICDGVAVDPKLIPYRTLVRVPGIGLREADDTGGAMRQNAQQGIYQIDVRMASHAQAREWGVKTLDISIYRPIAAAFFGAGSAAAKKPAAQAKAVAVPAIHLIKPGETLGEIALHYGLKPRQLASLNDIVDMNRIYAGQTLKLR